MTPEVRCPEGHDIGPGQLALRVSDALRGRVAQYPLAYDGLKVSFQASRQHREAPPEMPWVALHEAKEADQSGREAACAHVLLSDERCDVCGEFVGQTAHDVTTGYDVGERHWWSCTCGKGQGCFRTERAAKRYADDHVKSPSGSAPSLTDDAS